MTTETYPENAVRFSGFVGDSFDYMVTVEDDSGPVDMSSATFNFVLGSLTEASSGVTISGNAGGEITVQITNTAMAAITAGDHDISLQYIIDTLTNTLFAGTYTAMESLL